MPDLGTQANRSGIQRAFGTPKEKETTMNRIPNTPGWETQARTRAASGGSWGGWCVLRICMGTRQ